MIDSLPSKALLTTDDGRQWIADADGTGFEDRNYKARSEDADYKIILDACVCAIIDLAEDKNIRISVPNSLVEVFFSKVPGAVIRIKTIRTVRVLLTDFDDSGSAEKVKEDYADLFKGGCHCVIKGVQNNQSVSIPCSIEFGTIRKRTNRRPLSRPTHIRSSQRLRLRQATPQPLPLPPPQPLPLPPPQPLPLPPPLQAVSERLLGPIYTYTPPRGILQPITEGPGRIFEFSLPDSESESESEPRMHEREQTTRSPRQRTRSPQRTRSLRR
jgi:hypothetical protein